MNRYSITFFIIKDKIKTPKFEIHSTHGKINAKGILSAKYPEYEVEIVRITPTISALANID